MELVKVLNDYETFANELMQIILAIYAVAIVEENNEIVYSTDNWDISYDLEHVCKMWNIMGAHFYGFRSKIYNPRM